MTVIPSLRRVALTGLTKSGTILRPAGSLNHPARCALRGNSIPHSPMNITHISDVLAGIFAIVVIVGYHVYLRVRTRRDPDYTIQALLNKGRAAWVERMMKEKEGILAVQTLRNSIMGATFFASTSVALIVGTITLSTQGDKLAQAWNALSPLAVVDESM